MKGYDSEGLSSHILSVHTVEEHSAGLGSVKHQEYPYKIKLSIFDDIVPCTGTRVNMVYIHNGNDKGPKGYYYLVASYKGFSYSLLHCAQPPEGYLKVISMMDCYVIAQQCSRQFGDQTLTGDPKLAYDNYHEDLHSWQRHGCSRESHLINVIDKIIDNDSQGMTNNVAVDTMDMSPVADSMGENPVDHPNVSHDMTLSNGHTKDGNECKSYRDFNYPDKEVGYLAQADTDFKFIGPDGEPVEIDSVEKLITIADSIRNSGLPNYRGVRIPIKSDLNIEAWE